MNRALLVELVPFLAWERMPEELRARALDALADKSPKVPGPPPPDPSAIKGSREPMAIFLARRDGQVSIRSMRAEGYHNGGQLCYDMCKQGRLVRIGVGVYRLPDAP